MFFSGTYIPDDSRSAKRAPVPSDQLRIIQKECFELDDEARWLVAMISDTGMRLCYRKQTDLRYREQ